jgi:glycosyltransferase involved in cell wall biosynthesis
LLNQQTDYTFKIFITDDHSTDKTAEICKAYQQKHPELINFESLKENVGPVENWIINFRKCINSGATYIAICDGDDYWIDNNKLEKQLAFLESNPDYGMVYADQIYVDRENKQTPPNSYYSNRLGLYDTGDIFWNLFENNFINTSTTCFHLNLIKDFFPEPGDIEKTSHYFDYWLWLMIAKKSKVKFLNEKLATYRSHSNNLSMDNFFAIDRNSLIKLEIISLLDKKEINTGKKKEIVSKNLLAIVIKRKMDFKNRRTAFCLLLHYPPKLSFIINKLNAKILKTKTINE